MKAGTASAVAHSNIALIKYWGKSDTARNLPAVPSLSLTLDGLTTTTQVRFEPDLTSDRVMLDGSDVVGRERERVVELLDRARALARTGSSAVVSSRNDFPTAAGLASSASGFAALALAATRALGLSLTPSELSALARQSSASAARSLFGGFVNLLAGSECAVPLAPPEHWNVRLLVAVTQAGRKPMGSTEAMERTRLSSPYYDAWVKHAPPLHREAERAVRERQFDTLGACMEQSTLMMHSSMLASRPAIWFLTEATVQVIHHVRKLREAGCPAYFTIDAGPHVKVLTEARDSAAVRNELAALPKVLEVIECAPGAGAHIVEGPDG